MMWVRDNPSTSLSYNAGNIIKDSYFLTTPEDLQQTQLS